MGPGRPRLRRLMGDLCRLDARTRWRAVLGLGDRAEEAFAASPERASDLLRRLVWLLNDESGATGWGAPEAIGEILARLPPLRPGFSPLLVSWLDDESVNLDQEILDAGVIWAMGRIGPGEPFAEERLGPVLARFLAEGGPLARAVATWSAGRLRFASLGGAIRRCPQGLASGAEGPETFTLLIDGEIVDRSQGDLASEAIALLGG